jgi:hypothetical protein
MRYNSPLSNSLASDLTCKLSLLRMQIKLPRSLQWHGHSFGKSRCSAKPPTVRRWGRRTSRLIVTSTQNAGQVIADLQQALIQASPKYLKVHLEELRRSQGEVSKMLIG